MKFKGEISSFGGPEDYTDRGGYKPSEKLGLIYKITPRNKHLFLPGNEVGERAGLARKLDPDKFYCAMRFPLISAKWSMVSDDIDDEVNYWAQFRILVRKPESGVTIMCESVDTGPAQNTKREVDLSPGALTHLGAKTDETLEFILLGTRDEWPELLEPEEAAHLWNGLDSVRLMFTRRRGERNRLFKPFDASASNKPPENTD